MDGNKTQNKAGFQIDAREKAISANQIEAYKNRTNQMASSMHLKIHLSETVQSPKQELQQRLGPNRRHSLGTPADESIRGDYQKYMRMWHTAFYN